jgi:hypothetical protein
MAVALEWPGPLVPLDECLLARRAAAVMVDDVVSPGCFAGPRSRSLAWALCDGAARALITRQPRLGTEVLAQVTEGPDEPGGGKGR